jgi:Protein of unknown function (DUF998)
VLAVLSLVALALGAGAVVRLHFSGTGLSPVRDAVSDYGTTESHLLYRVQVVAFGVSALLLMAALADDDGIARAGLVWLSIYGAARIAIAWFMIDRDLSKPTTEGRVHALLAAVAFTAIAVAATMIGADLGDGFHALGWVVAGTAIATAVFRVLPPLRPWFGLVERLLYVATAAWIAAVALHVA